MDINCLFVQTFLFPIVLFSISFDSKTDPCFRPHKTIPQDAPSFPPAAPLQVRVDVLYEDID